MLLTSSAESAGTTDSALDGPQQSQDALRLSPAKPSKSRAAKLRTRPHAAMADLYVGVSVVVVDPSSFHFKKQGSLVRINESTGGAYVQFEKGACDTAVKGAARALRLSAIKPARGDQASSPLSDVDSSPLAGSPQIAVNEHITERARKSRYPGVQSAAAGDLFRRQEEAKALKAQEDAKKRLAAADRKARNARNETRREDRVEKQRVSTAPTFTCSLPLR